MVLRVHAGGPRLDGRLDLRSVVAEERLEPLVPPELVGEEVPVPDRVVRGLRELSEPELALAEPLQQPTPLRHVAHVDGEPLVRRKRAHLEPRVDRVVVRVEVDRDPLVGRASHVRLEAVARVVAEVAPEIRAQQIRARAPEQPLRLRVDVHEAPGVVDQHERVREALDRRGEARRGARRVALESLVLVDVDPRAVPDAHAPVGVADRHRVHAEPPVHPVPTTQPILDLVRRSVAHTGGPGLEADGDVVGVYTRLPARLRWRVERDARVREEGRVRVVHRSVRVGGPDDERHRVGELLEAPPALADRRLREALRRDVEQRPLHPCHAPRGVSNRLADRAGPHVHAVRPHDLAHDVVRLTGLDAARQCDLHRLPRGGGVARERLVDRRCAARAQPEDREDLVRPGERRLRTEIDPPRAHPHDAARHLEERGRTTIRRARLVRFLPRSLLARQSRRELGLGDLQVADVLRDPHHAGGRPRRAPFHREAHATPDLATRRGDVALLQHRVIAATLAELAHQCAHAFVILGVDERGQLDPEQRLRRTLEHPCVRRVHLVHAALEIRHGDAGRRAPEHSARRRLPRQRRRRATHRQSDLVVVRRIEHDVDVHAGLPAWNPRPRLGAPEPHREHRRPRARRRDPVHRVAMGRGDQHDSERPASEVRVELIDVGVTRDIQPGELQASGQLVRGIEQEQGGHRVRSSNVTRSVVSLWPPRRRDRADGESALDRPNLGHSEHEPLGLIRAASSPSRGRRVDATPGSSRLGRIESEGFALSLGSARHATSATPSRPSRVS